MSTGSMYLNRALPVAMNLPLRLKHKCEEAQDIVSFEFVHARGLPLPPFEAGSHVLIQISPDTVRAYSLCNDPAECSSYLVGVQIEPTSRGGSAGMNRLSVGDDVWASAPWNAFPLVEGASHHLLIGGGIGITPLMAMAESLAQAGSSFELHYCFRERKRAAFLDRLRAPRLASHRHEHSDDGPENQRFNAAQVLASPHVDLHLYVCGPSGFMDHVLQTAKQLGWSSTNLHFERFAPTANPLDLHRNQAFDVVVESTGQRVTVGAHESAVEALRRASIPIFTSCEQGTCGTCITEILSGTPEHRDTYLTEEDKKANNCFLPCCSRALTGELVIAV